MQEGVKIYPKQVEAISHFPLPRIKKEVQAILGRINFLRRFIPNYAKIVKGITNMLKNENEVEWIPAPQYSFTRIEEDLAEAPILVILDYLMPLYIFYFASLHIIAAILLQKNKYGCEQTISLFIQILRDVEMKYNLLEKQAYALVKALKAFRMFVLQLEITTFVPTTMVKDILVQGYSEGKRRRWIEKLQGYELDIKPTKLIKGQGLAKVLS